MGIQEKHALGRTQRVYVAEESIYGTFVKPVGTDAIKVLGTSMEYTQERTNRLDSRQTRSFVERITRRKAVSWNLNAYLLSSGAAGTPPDVGDLLKIAMGLEVTGADTQYTLKAGQTELGSATLIREMEGIFMEAIVGAWVEQFTISISGTDEPKIAFEGGASDYIPTGNGTAVGAVDGTTTPVTEITVGTGEGVGFSVNSIIQVGTDDNTASGFTVTAIAGEVLSITPDLETDQGSAPEVIPFVPTETTAGSPIALVLGSMELDAVTIPVTALEIVCKNNVKPINDEAFSSVAVSDYIPGFRDVTGSMTLRMKKSTVIEHIKRKSFSARDIKVTVGDTPGSRLIVDLDYAEFDLTAVEVPESEEATFTLPFMALGSSGEDELKLTFD